MRILAIDPGNEQSAYCLIDAGSMRPLQFDKTDNAAVRAALGQREQYDRVVIEMIGHYGTGMPAGKSVFDTCVWIGRFLETVERLGLSADLVMRREEKLDLCGSGLRPTSPTGVRAGRISLVGFTDSTPISGRPMPSASHILTKSTEGCEQQNGNLSQCAYFVLDGCKSGRRDDAGG